MNILLVEDSKFLSASVAKVLGKQGYTVSTAKDGEEGLRRARETAPELIVLDMMLPKISGLDVLSFLKQHRGTQDIPVIVLTSLSERNTEKLLQAGAAAFVPKSEALLENDARALIQTIHRVIGEPVQQ